MTRRVHGNKPWGGQFWTPITPDRGSIFHADQHWRYRGDAAPHIGPYAEDFAAAFAGDGRSIDLMDAVGATMSAVKGLAARVEALAGRLDGAG